jgi:phage terminase large subunit GpA-like protein
MLPGDPANVTATGPWWRAGGLHDILTASYLTEAGGRLQVMCMTVDSGDRPSLVYDFARRHPQPVFGPSGSYCPAYGCVAATKGNDAADKLISAVSNVDVARQQRGGVRIFSIGTHFAKQELFDLLRLTPIPVPEENGGGMSYPAGYCHRPAYDRTYFQGVCSETRVVRPTGKVEWVADPSIRNEPLDLFVLNRAAASIAGVDRFKEHDWQRLEHKAGTLADNTPTPCAPAPATTASGAGQSQPGRNRRPIRGRFL